MAADSDPEEPMPARGPMLGKVLLTAMLILSVAATVVLVLSDSARWLRFAVLAALWAALFAAFLAAKYRKQATESDKEAADLQGLYELELEREIAARREYELEIETDTRRRLQAENRDDLAGLRAELGVLREYLERLTGGEVLVERFAVQAQRMRAFAGKQGESAAIELEQPLSITAAQASAPTMLIPAVVSAPVAAEQSQAPRAKPQPRPTRIRESMATIQRPVSEVSPVEKVVEAQQHPADETGHHHAPVEPESLVAAAHTRRSASENPVTRQETRRLASEEPALTGAHAFGRSVTDLLAAHRAPNPTPARSRHHRRAP